MNQKHIRFFWAIFAHSGLILPLVLLLTHCGGGLYQPGEAVRIAGIPLPPQDRPGFFHVEEDVYLNYFADGTGKEILFLHGGPGIPFMAPPEGLHRLQGFRVVYPQERGSGLSTRPIGHFASSNYYANMKELDRRLGLSVHLADIERMRILLKKERLTIIGHSFGGFLAALYAAEFPDHVDRLVLVAPAGVLRLPPPDGGLYDQVRRHLPSGDVPTYDAYLKRLFDYRRVFERNETELSALNQEFFPYYAKAARVAGMPGLSVIESGPAQVVKQGTSERAEPGAQMPATWVGGWVTPGLFFSLGRECDLRFMLKKIQARTLLIHGGRDLSPPESSSDYLAIPGIHRKIMADSGHFPFSDHPEEFARIVQEFLSSQGNNRE